MPVPARFELKYIIAPALVAPLRAAIAPYCVLDEHCARAPRQRYRITSLYLDAPDLAFYRAKIDRAPHRLKLRVRTYDTPGAPVFLEVKRKLADVVKKTRAVVGERWAAEMAAPSTSDPALHDFAAVLGRSRAEPKLLVRYEREAWASTVDEYARVTFDYALEYQPWSEPSLDGRQGGFVPLDDPDTCDTAFSPVILELKAAERAPSWMIALVRRFDLMRRGFSKYASGVDQLWGRTRAHDRWQREPMLGPP